MLVKLMSPANKVEKVRQVDLQHYLNLGYKQMIVQEVETVELMSPAGKIVVLKRDVDDYLQREGWSLLKDELPEEPEMSEIPEIPNTSAEGEIPEELEAPAEDEILEEPEALAENELSVEAEQEMLEVEGQEAQLED